VTRKEMESNIYTEFAQSLLNALDSEVGPRLNIIEFIEKEVNLGIELTSQQLLILKLIYGIELSIEDIAILEYWQLQGRTSWTNKRSTKEIQNFIFESGRRSGKTTIMAIICAYEFYYLAKLDNPQEFFGISSNTPISILVLATTADQGKKGIYRSTAGILRNSKYFNLLMEEKKIFIGKEEISYEEKGIYIQTGNSKSSSQVGMTIKCIVMDEVARFQNEEGASNALSIWSDLGISCAPFKDKAKRIAISSAWYEGDAIQKLCEIGFKDRENSLSIIARSWDINPVHAARDNPIIDAEYRLDPIKAALQFEGIRPAYADAFLNADQIDVAFQEIVDCINAETQVSNDLICLRINKIEETRAFQSWVHIDPAITTDSYSLVLGHKKEENGVTIIIIDSLLAWQPTYTNDVSMTDVGKVIKQINRARPIQKVTADHYNSAETIQRLKMAGIRAEAVFFSNKLQRLMYDNLRQLLHEKRIKIANTGYWAATAIRELKQVQLIRGQKIDHPPNGSKDLADGIAAVAYYLSKQVVDRSSIKTMNSNRVYTSEAVPLSNNKHKVLSSLKRRRDWQKHELKNNYKMER
jgi:hypothetical protein